MTEQPRCAVGVPCVGPFGDPRLLVDLAVATEEAGWDGFFLWDHLLWSDPEGHVADPTVVISAVAGRTERIRIGIMVNMLARRRPAKVARETVTLDGRPGGRVTGGRGLGRGRGGGRLGPSTGRWRGVPTAPPPTAAVGSSPPMPPRD